MGSQRSLLLWSLAQKQKYPNRLSQGWQREARTLPDAWTQPETPECGVSRHLEGLIPLCFLGLPHSQGCALLSSGLAHQLVCLGLASFFSWPSEPMESVNTARQRSPFLVPGNSGRAVLYFVSWGGLLENSVGVWKETPPSLFRAPSSTKRDSKKAGPIGLHLTPGVNMLKKTFWLDIVFT